MGGLRPGAADGRSGRARGLPARAPRRTLAPLHAGGLAAADARDGPRRGADEPPSRRAPAPARAQAARREGRRGPSTRAGGYPAPRWRTALGASCAAVVQGRALVRARVRVRARPAARRRGAARGPRQARSPGAAGRDGGGPVLWIARGRAGAVRGARVPGARAAGRDARGGQHRAERARRPGLPRRDGDIRHRGGLVVLRKEHRRGGRHVGLAPVRGFGLPPATGAGGRVLRVAARREHRRPAGSGVRRARADVARGSLRTVTRASQPGRAPGSSAPPVRGDGEHARAPGRLGGRRRVLRVAAVER